MLIDEIRLAAKEIYPDNLVLAKLCFAQACLESGLPDSVSSLAIECKNLFGIKDTDGRGYKEYWTTECDKNSCKKVKQNFEVYQTFQDCFNHHRWLMQRPRYAKVWKAKSFEEACSEVSKAGYATDPKYPLKLIQRYKSSGGI